MNNQISPFERAQQILQSIEMEEKQKQSKNKNKAKAAQSKQKQDKIDTTVKKIDPSFEESPIYLQEIGSEQTLIDITPENVLKGIIFSEVLGKPKSRFKGR